MGFFVPGTQDDWKDDVKAGRKKIKPRVPSKPALGKGKQVYYI